MRSVLVAVGGLGPHDGGPWRCKGLGLSPGLARGHQNLLNCTPVCAGALFYWHPGMQVMANDSGDWNVMGPIINLNIA